LNNKFLFSLTLLLIASVSILSFGSIQDAEASHILITTTHVSDGNCETQDNCFSPSTLTLPVNSTVTWENDHTSSHTITSGTPTQGPNGIFDSGELSQNGTFEFTFTEDGIFDYYCTTHPWMKGVVTISEGHIIIQPEPIKKLKVSIYATSVNVDGETTITIKAEDTQERQSAQIKIIAEDGRIIHQTSIYERYGGNTVQWKISNYEAAGTYTIIAFDNKYFSQTTFDYTN